MKAITIKLDRVYVPRLDADLRAALGDKYQGVNIPVGTDGKVTLRHNPDENGNRKIVDGEGLAYLADGTSDDDVALLQATVAKHDPTPPPPEPTPEERIAQLEARIAALEGKKK